MSNPAKAPANAKHHETNRSLGISMGVVSAVGYTLANVCLRYVSDVDPFFVATIRTIPTFGIVLPILVFRQFQGQHPWKPYGQVFILVAAGLGGQILGNVGFQASLKFIGLAIAVPIVLGSMIVTGALIGWLILGESVGRFTQLGIAVLIVALTLFAIGANNTAKEPSDSIDAITATMIAFGVAATISAGLAYSVMGVVMRRAFQHGISPELSMLVLSSVGLVVLGAISFVRLDIQDLALIRRDQWVAMFAAGAFNAVAFFALSLALKHINLVSVHLLNASQAAMALAAGAIFFNEPLSGYLYCGLILTVIGMLLAGRNNKRGSRPIKEGKPIREGN